jgi:putative ABC transport system ATP-binding protein
LSDQEITSLGEDARAQIRGEKVGFIFQSFHLLPRLSAVDNVMLPLEIKGDKQAKEKALKALTRVGLNKRASHLPNQLSGGEKQRVAIARAFVTRPAILFADEPTGNLDKASSQSVGELLFSINQELDTTLILVTHNTTLSERCELVHQLDEGRIQ